MNIIDVHEDQMRGDPRDWMTKAMTEEKAPRPSGKGPKGLARSRHQITYLAHQAKERSVTFDMTWFTILLQGLGAQTRLGHLQGEQEGVRKQIRILVSVVL